MGVHMSQFIITLGREYGSGGHEIATIIAEKLGIPLYDEQILHGIADMKQVEMDQLKEYSEKHKTFEFTRSVRGYSTSVSDHIATLEHEYILQKAKLGESFIVVGRAAEYILRDYPIVSIFVRAPFADRVERVKRIYKLGSHKAARKIIEVDTERRAFHNFHCKNKKLRWGHSHCYDLCVNSSKMGIEKTADFLAEYVKAVQNNTKENTPQI